MSFNFKQANVQRFNSYTLQGGTLKLTAENSGSMIFLDCWGTDFNLVIDLPPLQDSVGLHFNFLITASTAGNTIKIAARDKAGDLESKLFIKGNYESSNANKVVTFTIADPAQVGDKISVISDGVYWFVNHYDASTTTMALGAS